MFQVMTVRGRARRGVFTCAHGTVQTPVFMNVGTQGAIKGRSAPATWRKSAARLSCPTPTTSTSGRGTRRSAAWAGCTK